MRNNRKPIALGVAIAMATLCIAGTKVSQMRRTTTLASNDLFSIVRYGSDGRRTNLSIEARNVGRGLGQWITNEIGSGGGSYDDSNLVGATNGLNQRVGNLETGQSNLQGATNGLHSGLQSLIGRAVTNINEGNIIYVRTNGNNGTANRSGGLSRPWLTVEAANAAAVIGDVLDIGAGTFPLASFVTIPHGVTWRGKGTDATIISASLEDFPVINPGSSGAIEDMTIRNRGASGVYYGVGTFGVANGMVNFTNAILRRVKLDVTTAAIEVETQTGDPVSMLIEDCVGTTVNGSIYWLGTNNALTVRNSYFLVSGTGATNNPSRSGRGPVIGEGASAIFQNTHFEVTNQVTVTGFLMDEYLFLTTRSQMVSFASCSISLNATNGGTVTPYEFNGLGTNSVVFYRDLPMVEVSKATAISTNSHGPQIVNLTETGNRTNWLPNIAYGGVQRFPDLRVTIKDAAGTAGTAPISIRGLGGQTIDGASSYSLDANYGEVTLRVKGTNWVTESVNGALLSAKQDASTTLDAISGIGAIGFMALTGVGTAAAREITVGSGLEISESEGENGNPLISLDLDTVINGGVPNSAGALVDWSQLRNVPAGFVDGTDDGGGGGTGSFTTIRTNAAVAITNGVAMLFTNAPVASPVGFNVGSNAGVATISATIQNMSGSGNAAASNSPTLFGATLLGSTVGGTANFTDGSIGTFSTTDLLVEGPATVESNLRVEGNIWTPGNVTNALTISSNGVVLYEKPLTQSSTNLVADGLLSGSFSNSIIANVGGLTNILWLNMADGVTYDLWLSISPGVTVQFPQLSSGTNWTDGRVPSFVTNTTPVLVKATRRGVITNATVFQQPFIVKNGPGVVAVTNFVTGEVTYMLDGALTNLMGTVARNVTNENSTALEINSGTLSLSSGALSNLVNNTSLDFKAGNVLTNVASIKFVTHQPAITTSNFVWSFNTNRHYLIGVTNAIFTNLVELSGVIESADMAVYIHNTTGVSMGLVWPAFGAQHGYYFSTNQYNDVRSKTSLASGARGLLSLSIFGTNIVPTWTDW